MKVTDCPHAYHGDPYGSYFPYRSEHLANSDMSEYDCCDTYYECKFAANEKMCDCNNFECGYCSYNDHTEYERTLILCGENY